MLWIGPRASWKIETRWVIHAQRRGAAADDNLLLDRRLACRLQGAQPLAGAL
jgi:hypothetical protein